MTVISKAQKDLPRAEVVDGIEIVRLPFHRLARIMMPAALVTHFVKRADILVDNGDIGFPWLTPLYTRKPSVSIIYQASRQVFRSELDPIQSTIAMNVEPIIHRLYAKSVVVTCSPSTKYDLVQDGIPAENIRVIRPGLGDDFLKFEPVAKKFSNPTITCISRFRRYKGLHYPVRAMKFVLEKVPNARLVIVGNGNPEEVLNEVAQTKYSKSVDILVRRPNEWNDEKRTLLSKSHLLIIPSVREGYGIVVLEANACGTPAIGWTVAGLQDSIIDGQTGILVPYGNTELLSERITDFLVDDTLRVKMGASAVTWARQHSWEKAAREFDVVLDSIRR